MSKHFLCIGSSAAGLSAASKLRQLDATAKITVLTAEKEMPYNRCSLSKYLALERSNEQIRTRTKDFFTDNNIELHLNTRVVALEPKAQSVITAQGQTFGYDQLFLGMGKSSSKSTIPGANARGVFNYYDLDDSNNILMYIQKSGIKHCLIIGAGVTGLECADALTKRGLSVSLVNRSAYLLSKHLDQEGAQYLESLVNASGVVLYKNVTVNEIQSVQGRVAGAVLSDGTVVNADMIIFAMGNQTNSHIAQEAGIVTERSAIKTNEFLQTSIENIYAGGDIALVQNLLTQRYEQSTLWSDAGMQGLFAAQNMVGEQKVYTGILPITSTFIFGTRVAFIGDMSQQHAYQDVVKKNQQTYHRFLFDQGVLKGFIVIGNMLNVGSLRQAILSKQVLAAAL